MRAKAQKWGNSLAVRLPKVVADQAGVREHDEWDIEVAARVIRLKPRGRELRLAEILRKVTPDNLHGQASFGGPEGRETW